MPTAMSPEVQAYGQPPTSEQAEQLFKEKFSEMAYSVLFAKFADIAPSVVTFKVLEVNVDNGQAVGAFVILHNDKAIYIPIVMTDSQLKPMEMFYYKDLNIFLPLSKQWLDEISKMSLDEMGESAEIPGEVPQDVNIRNLIRPPQTSSGRVGLASDMSEEVMDHTARGMFKEAANNNLDVHPKFMDFIRNAPAQVLDGVKLSFERHPNFLKKVAEFYGTTELVNSFEEGYARSAANKPLPRTPGSVHILDKYASPDQIKEVFGTDAPDAFAQILKQGFAYKDSRPGVEKVAVKVEGVIQLDSPGPEAGFYKLFFVDASADTYFVLPWPHDGDSDGPVSHCDDSYYDGCRDRRAKPINYLVISKDGKTAWTDTNIVGQKMFDPKEYQGSKIFNVLGNAAGDTPAVGDKGFFICYSTAGGFQATEPLTIETLVTVDGRTRINAEYGSTYIKDDDPSRVKIQSALKDSFVFLPADAKWVRMYKRERRSGGDGFKSDYDSEKYIRSKRNSVVKDPSLISRWLNQKLQRSGAMPVEVKQASVDEVWIGNSREMYRVPSAIQKIAMDYGISVPDAAGVLRDVRADGRTHAFAVGVNEVKFMKAAFYKEAQRPEEVTVQAEGMAPPQAPMGSPMGGGDPGMMPPGPPPGPPQSPMSATDLAIAETVDQLQQQSNMQMQQMQDQMMQQQQAMQMQQENNQQLIGVLQQIQQRSTEIDQATGGFIPAGAEASPAVAAQQLAPTPPPQPEPPPTPMMSEEDSSPEMIAEQINPELAEQAGELQDQGVFDTASIATLAAAPILQDLVATYIPNLEKSLDNLGRILLTLWMQEADVKESIGDEAFISLEEKLRHVFKGLGEVILEVNQNAVSTQAQGDESQMMMMGDHQQ